MTSEALVLNLTGPEATIELGCELGKLLQGGEVIALRGDLGAGKTTLIQGLSRGLQIPPETAVTSPTFVLVINLTGGRLDLNHIDLYRLDLDEAIELGLEEILAEDEPGSPVTAIEWAERAEELLPLDRLEIKLAWTGPETRQAELRSLGPRAARVAGEMARLFDSKK